MRRSKSTRATRALCIGVFGACAAVFGGGVVGASIPQDQASISSANDSWFWDVSEAFRSIQQDPIFDGGRFIYQRASPVGNITLGLHQDCGRLTTEEEAHLRGLVMSNTLIGSRVTDFSIEYGPYAVPLVGGVSQVRRVPGCAIADAGAPQPMPSEPSFTG